VSGRLGASLVLALVFWLSTAQGAQACSVCIGTGTPDTRNTWLAMTAFMTFTPLAVLGGVIFWLRSRFRALDARQDAERLGLTNRTAGLDGPSHGES